MHDDDYEDDERLTREEMRERYEQIFGTPEEQAAMQAEMAERQQRIDAERRAAEARSTIISNDSARVVEKTHAMRKRDEAAGTEWWKTYIREQLDKNNNALLSAIAGAVVGEERQRERDVAEARSHYRDICARFDDHPRHDEITALRKTIDELRARLERLEAAGKATPLRAVG